MDTVKSTLQAVQMRIARAAEMAGRTAQDITLLAVSKRCEAESIRALSQAGQRAFGESYVQEAVPKIEALTDLNLSWHFIGPIQRNKTHLIASMFDWVHSVDRMVIAQRLSAARPAERPPLNICLQVNVSDETSKSGVAPQQLAELAAQIATLPRLHLRGLMTIPRATDDVASQRAQFAQLRQCLEQLNAQGAALDTLSMGMSNDLEAAILEGATIVRIGTALFGTRSQR